MMLGHTANAKKSSKFEDSDGRMPRPRAVSELPQRSSPRLKAGSEAGAGAPRRSVGGARGTAPRSPLHEKKPVGAAGAGAGPRVAELEAKLEKAHGQLTEMREQLTAAEKARKEARSALVEAKKRFAVKKRDDVVANTSTIKGDDHSNFLATAAAGAAADVEAVGATDEKGGVISSPAIDVLDAFVPSERENHEEAAKNTTGKQEVSDNNVILNCEKSPEVDELRAKLTAKDMEVYELRAKLMVRDTEMDELREALLGKNTELDELKEALAAKDTALDELKGKLASSAVEVNKLTASLMAKDADIAALEADNADLTRMAEEASAAVKATAARARETEHALRESAAREARVAELLRASERAREALEAEAQRSSVQSEQWRKAAEEAAVVLGGADTGAPVAAGTPPPGADKRCHGTAGAGERNAKGAEEDGAGKRKPGAMRVISDLWKKKAQK